MEREVKYTEHDLKYAFICGWLSARVESLFKMSKSTAWKESAAKLIISLPLAPLWRYIKPKYFDVYFKDFVGKVLKKQLDND